MINNFYIYLLNSLNPTYPYLSSQKLLLIQISILSLSCLFIQNITKNNNFLTKIYNDYFLFYK